MWDGFGRLNMRGIVFIDKKLVALALPKFFNIGENESVQNLDISNPKSVFLKVDGSLISLFKIGDHLECKSMKSVYSDVSNACREYLKTRPDIREYSLSLIEKNYSPLFEYVSPKSRIVILYKEQEMYYLGCRDMSTGQIILPNEDHPVNKIRPSSIVLPTIFTRDTMDEFLNRETTDIDEGVVLTLQNGLMVKTDRYCKVHRVVTTESSSKHIFENIINGTSDDAKGILYQHGLLDSIKRIEDIEKYYRNRFDAIYKKSEEYYNENKHRDRKSIATELFGNQDTRLMGSIVMCIMDGKKEKCSDIINKAIKDEVCERFAENNNPDES
jgi:RNA ligase